MYQAVIFLLLILSQKPMHSICNVPDQQGDLSLYQKFHQRGESVPDLRQKPRNRSTDIPQPPKLPGQSAGASLPCYCYSISNPYQLVPRLPPSSFLLQGHKIPQLSLLGSQDWVVSATGREVLCFNSLPTAR